MKYYKTTTNGRITIPIELREKFNLNPGRKVKFWHSHSFGRNAEDGIRIIPFPIP